MLQKTSMNSADELTFLARKLGIEGDEISESNNDNDASQTKDQNMTLQPNSKFAQGESNVLVLIDTRSHPMIDPHINIERRLTDAIESKLSVRTPAEAPRTYRIDARAFTHAVQPECAFLDISQNTGSESAHLNSSLVEVKAHKESSVEQDISDALLGALVDRNCIHVFLTAWRHPMYLLLARSTSSKATVVENKAMGCGVNLISLPCKIDSLPGVFDTASGTDLLAGEFIWYETSSVIGSLIAWQDSDKARCAKNQCGLPHARLAATSLRHATWRTVGMERLRTSEYLPIPSQSVPDHVPVNKEDNVSITTPRLPRSPAERHSNPGLLTMEGLARGSTPWVRAVKATLADTAILS